MFNKWITSSLATILLITGAHTVSGASADTDHLSNQLYQTTTPFTINTSEERQTSAAGNNNLYNNVGLMPLLQDKNRTIAVKEQKGSEQDATKNDFDQGDVRDKDKADSHNNIEQPSDDRSESHDASNQDTSKQPNTDDKQQRKSDQHDKDDKQKQADEQETDDDQPESSEQNLDSQQPGQSEQQQSPPSEQSDNTHADAQQSSEQLSEFERQVVKMTNEKRSEQGLEPLQVDTDLSEVARKKSRDMQANHYFSHESPNYGSPFDMMEQFGISYQTAGENIARGQDSPEKVVEGWMNSEDHRENIMNPDFTHIGVGYAEEGNYWTQQFIGK